MSGGKQSQQMKSQAGGERWQASLSAATGTGTADPADTAGELCGGRARMARRAAGGGRLGPTPIGLNTVVRQPRPRPRRIRGRAPAGDGAGAGDQAGCGDGAGDDGAGDRRLRCRGVASFAARAQRRGPEIMLCECTLYMPMSMCIRMCM